MPGRLDFTYGFASDGGSAARKRSTTMHILLMGDFSGRQAQDRPQADGSLEARVLFKVDVDNFEQVMTRLSPRLILPIDDSDLSLDFKSLEDFHPDSLYRRLTLFRALKSTRDGLANDRTYQQTLHQLKAGEVSAIAAPEKGTQAETEEDLFKRLLGEERPRSDPQRQMAEDSIDRFIQGIVAAHIVPDAGAERQTYIRSVDDAISSEMRRVLHHPHFQALESVWRSAHRLVSGLEDDETLKIYLLDVSKQDLQMDLSSAGDALHNSGLYRKLVEQHGLVPEGEPWTLLAGHYDFAQNDEDIDLLAALGAIAAQAGGPFLATASPALFGCDDYSQLVAADSWRMADPELQARWQALRASPIAPWIGLVLPRLLLRLPYGADLDEIDSFEFEELPDPAAHHGDLLWGSPAFACAQLLASNLQQYGFSSAPGALLDIEDLPAVVFETDGQRELIPCAETWLSERTAETLLANGAMPLMSYRNRNAARLLRFQSLAVPPQGLRGVWA